MSAAGRGVPGVAARPDGLGRSSPLVALAPALVAEVVRTTTRARLDRLTLGRRERLSGAGTAVDYRSTRRASRSTTSRSDLGTSTARWTDLNFDAPARRIFGFLGANGAGKTTTMRICLGILDADAGEVRWNGTRTTDLPRRTWGYLPEERGLYPRMAVLDQLVYFATLYGLPVTCARRGALDWLDPVPDRRLRRPAAEELSKGNQQKVQFIAAILHEPDVLLMDEPFTGLDPVNLALLREAFVELRDQGRTIVFSTHQMEAAEALCESLAIVDHGRVVAGGTLARGRSGRAGRRTSAWASTGETMPAWLAGVRRRHRRATRRRLRRARAPTGVEPAPCSRRRSLAARPSPLRVAEPSLEAIFIELVGRVARRRATRRARRRARTLPDVPPDPLLPNAAIVARREYRDRRAPACILASTLILMVLAVRCHADAHRRPLSRPPDGTQSRSCRRTRPSPSHGGRRRALNVPPHGVDTATWEPRHRGRLTINDAQAARDAADPAGSSRGSAGCDGRLHVTSGRTDRRRVRASSSASPRSALAVLDWTRPPRRSQLDPFQTPQFDVESLNAPTIGGRPVSQQEIASRGFLGIVFVVLMFMCPDLRDVGRDRSGRREEQPGDGAHDQRRLATAARDRQGRGDRRRPGSPSTSPSLSRRCSCSRSRTASP